MTDDLQEVEPSKDQAIEEQPTISKAERLKAYSWQPGISGNPKGKAPGTKDGIRAQLKRLLKAKGKDAVIDRLKEEGIDLIDKSASGVIAGVLIDQGQDGDKDAIKMVLEQTEIPLPRNVKIDSTVQVHTIQRVMIDVRDAASGLIDLPAKGEQLQGSE